MRFLMVGSNWFRFISYESCPQEKLWMNGAPNRPQRINPSRTIYEDWPSIHASIHPRMHACIPPCKASLFRLCSSTVVASFPFLFCLFFFLTSSSWCAVGLQRRLHKELLLCRLLSNVHCACTAASRERGTLGKTPPHHVAVVVRIGTLLRPKDIRRAAGSRKTQRSQAFL